MRSLSLALALAGAALDGSSGAAQEGGRLILTDRHIIVVHPSSPERPVFSYEGWCGRTRYRVVIHAQYEDWQRRIHSVRVGRREIGAHVRASIDGRIGPTRFLQSASFDQCSDEADAARLRLSLVDRAIATGRVAFLDLWIRQDGGIASVRDN